MTYLVTGGAGFIGSHLVDKLVKSGYKTIVVDDLSSGYKDNLMESELIVFFKEKIQNFSDFNFSELNGIYHLAAQASVPISIDSFCSSSSNNLLSTLKVFELAKSYKIPVVYASSSAIYGNLPVGNDMEANFEIMSPYALDKLTQENYAKLCYEIYKINSIGLRFFNVYGPRQDPTNPYSGVISIFIDHFLKSLPVQINGGYQTRDFIYVDDVVKSLFASMDLLQKDKNIYDFINVGTGVSITIDTLFNELTEIASFIPEKIYKPLPEGDPDKSGGTYSKLANILNLDLNKFKPFSEGLKETFDYFKRKSNEEI